jgi:hypothetical protein
MKYLWALLLLVPAILDAAPAPSGVTGTITHGQSVVIAGTGFGTKATAAPTIWDNCTGSSPGSTWDFAYPEVSGSPYDIVYSTVYNSVAMPHTNISKYMRGITYPHTSYNAGYQAGVGQNFTVSSFPYDVYLSYYFRVNPNWNHGDEASTTNNVKIFQASADGEPYGGTHYGYYEYSYFTNNTDSTIGMRLNNDGIGWPNPWEGDNPNPALGWHKLEFFVRFTDQTSGIVQQWVDGTLQLNQTGVVTTTAGTGTYNVGPMVYTGGVTYTADNTHILYFADLYIDSTAQRTQICNGSTWSARGLCENQIPSAWSNTEITATVNAGALTGTKYLYVVDSTGTANSSGYEITFGSADVTAPTLSSLTPSGDTVFATTKQLSVTTSENSTCRYHASSTTWANMSAMTSTGGTTHTQTVNVSVGANSFKAVCQDAAANESTAGTWSFTVLAEAAGAKTISIGAGSQTISSGGSQTIIMQ